MIKISKIKKFFRSPVSFFRDSNFMIDFSGSYYLKKRKELYNHFKNRTKNLSKLVAKEDEYPYTVYDPYLVMNDSIQYDKLLCIGDNWVNHKEKPIALMFGFNNWKYGFTTEYLLEYRVAFVPRRLSTISLLLLLKKLDPKPKVIIVWGYTESFVTSYFSKKYKIPIFRMEDGFVRSALLGATHATPYSLILDKKGLYYNPEVESDLESILNTYKFNEDEQLMKHARESLTLLQDMKISKYNSPSQSKYDKLGIKIKKRVVVLGQVDNDAAIKYGNPDKWSSEELVKLARYENPEAEVLYRPHPEVYKGYQKSKFRQKKIEYFAKVVSPEEPFLDFLETIDHVYVINSLSGLEALLRGMKVTVVGAAFYAGWGLTDDRYKINRRDRKLMLLELFAGVYLKYPRYLANQKDSYISLKATCYKISADAYVENFNIHKEHLKNKNIDALLASSYWPYFLFNNQDELSIKDEKTIISSQSFKSHFEGNDSPLLQILLLYFVIGKLRHEESRDFFIQKVRIYIDTQVFNQFLYDLSDFAPGDYIIKHIAWLLKENNEFNDANHLLSQHVEKGSLASEENRVLTLCSSNDNNTNTLSFCTEDIVKPNETIRDEIDIKTLIEALESYKTTLKYDNLVGIAKKLLIHNHASTLLFTRLCEVASLKMDNDSAILIAQFLQTIDIFAHNKVSVHMELENFDFDDSKESFEKITKLYALQLKLNPDRINRSWAILKNYFISNDYYNLFSSIASLYSKNDIHKSTMYLELNKPIQALNVLMYMIRKNEISDKLSVEYSKVLFILGKHAEAEKIIIEAVKKEATLANYTEYLRQLKSKGKFSKALEVAKEGLRKKIDLTYEGHIMPIYFGLDQLEEGFKCFHNTRLKQELIHAFGNEKYRNTDSMDNVDDLLLIFSSGPAEEIRFSSIYTELFEKLGCTNFKLTCDYRLKNILSRSFPNIDFIPIKRTRFFTPDHPVSNYNKLPSSELCNALDNYGLEYVYSSKKIKLVSEYFFHYRKNYDDFKNKKPHLIVDENRVKYFREKLPSETVLIGISWRSFLTNAMRNVHYLSIEEMAPIFEIANVKFVNLQYDECTHELEIIRDNYNIDIIDFPELDQMNDFDGVAGLMKNLDIVISPFTAVIELAGSIGVQGLLFSNHGESNWRRTENGIDVWYDSVKVIGSGKVGDKKQLVKDIKQEILTRI